MIREVHTRTTLVSYRADTMQGEIKSTKMVHILFACSKDLNSRCLQKDYSMFSLQFTDQTRPDKWVSLTQPWAGDNDTLGGRKQLVVTRVERRSYRGTTGTGGRPFPLGSGGWMVASWAQRSGEDTKDADDVEEELGRRARGRVPSARLGDGCRAAPAA